MMLLLDECTRVGRETSSTTDLFTGIEANLLFLEGYLCYYTSVSTSPPPWAIKDILLIVGFKLCTSKSRACNSLYR